MYDRAIHAANDATVNEVLDRQLDTDAGKGYRSEPLPPQREAWRRGLRVAEMARRGEL